MMPDIPLKKLRADTQVFCTKVEIHMPCRDKNLSGWRHYNQKHLT